MSVSPVEDGNLPLVPATEANAAAQGSGGSIEAAILEEQQLTSGKSPEQLKREADVNEFGRGERFKNHFELLAIIALYCSTAAIAGVALVWLAHLILPTRWRWLSTEDTSHLQSVATAGLLVGVIGNHFKKRLG